MDTARDQASATARPWISASASSACGAANNSCGRKLTIVSIMSIGAGSVGVSARPALPTTMSTSGKRQRTMLRAFMSSTDSVTDARGTVIGISMTMPLVERRHEFAGQGLHGLIGDQGHNEQARRSEHGGRHRCASKTGPIIAANRIARKIGRMPSGAKPRRKCHAQHPCQRRRVVDQIGKHGSINFDHASDQGFSISERSRPRMKMVQSAGTSVIARHATATSANVFVNASGWNIFLRCPPARTQAERKAP